MRVGLIALAGAALVAGCGESTSERQDRYESRLAETQLTADMLEMIRTTQGYTLAAEMPTTGTARYEGDLGILMGPDGDPDAALIGDLVMNADFAQGNVSGQATDFIGRVDGGETRDFSGSINLSNGLIGPGNSVNADASGTLTGGGHTVQISADPTGLFLGDSAQGIQMVDIDATGRLDGDLLSTQIVLQGQASD